jgi:hypothetical protein
MGEGMTPIGTIHTLNDYRSKAVFQSRADGEHALCRSCQRAGYGEDSWHPCLPDFWPKQDGKLRFDICRACKSERSARRFGLVTLEVTAWELQA